MRSQRGTTLIEVMVAATIMLVAMIGIVTAVNFSSVASGIAHRRTMSNLLRTYVAERHALTKRDTLDVLPTASQNVWIVDQCWDAWGQRTANNAALNVAFSCNGTYRSFIEIDPLGARTWRIRTYVERSNPGCVPGDRYSSIHCVAADSYLTD